MSAGEARRAARQHFEQAEKSDKHSTKILNYGLAYLRMEECCDKLIAALDRIAKTEAHHKLGQEWVHWTTHAEQALKEVQS